MNQKPGYFQTYPQAIKGILIALLAAIIFIAGIVWIIKHPIETIRLYAGLGFACAAVFAWTARSTGNKWLFGGLSVVMAALAVRSVWL